LRKILQFETYVSKNPVVFLVHPNEFIVENLGDHMIRREKSFFGYLWKDVIKRNLKIRNLGWKALDLYEQEILSFLKHGFNFITLHDFVKDYFEKNS
jgi:hypothetical protein